MSASLLFLFLGLASSYVLIRPLATLVHECGHILALRVLGMRGEMRVYLGSLGEWKGAWTWKTGRIHWFPHPRGLLMRGGLTDFDQALASSHWAMVALAGPLASTLLAGTAATIALVDWSAGPASLILLLVAVIASTDAVLSLFYRYPPICLSNARVTANDGQILGWWWRYRRDLDAYLHARWLFEKDQYAETIVAIEALIALGHREKLLYEYQMYAMLMMRQPERAVLLYQNLAQLHPLDAYDHSLYALAMEQLGLNQACGEALEIALNKAPGHHEALNHRAFLALRAGELTAALDDLQHALRSNPEFAAAYNNRAAIYLAQLDLEAARKDLVLALKLDHENPFIHLQWSRLLLLLENDHLGSKSALERARLLGLREADLFGG